MKSFFKKYLRLQDISADPADGFAFVYLLFAFILLTALTWNLGLYADDYWNLLEAAKHDGFSYFSNHMSQVNSRYTYALVNRVLFLLFYDPHNVFSPVYIHVAGVFILSLHFVGVWFVYKSLARLRVPKLGLLCLLPFLSFPVYGHQALMWLGAAFAYPVGFALLSAAVFALLSGRSILFAVLMFFSLGATEFVLLPGFAVAGLVWLLRPTADKTEPFFSKKRLTQAFILLSPFIAWALLVGLTPAAASRTGKIHAHPKLFSAPQKWLVSYFDVFLRQLQPEVWMQKHWYIFPAALIAISAFIKGLKTKLFVLFLASLYFLSILPLSAVGYDFRPIRTARVWYLPGIFFYIAVLSGIALSLQRIPVEKHLRRFQIAGRFGTIAVVTVFTILFATRMADISTEGERAYRCIQGIIHTIEIESEGKIPKRAEVCGFAPALYDFSIFRSPYAGPYALGLAFQLHRTIPFTRTEKCEKKWGTPWTDSRCPFKAQYKIKY